MSSVLCNILLPEDESMSPKTGTALPPGSVIGAVVVHEGDVCRVRISDDGKTVVPEIWRRGRWVSGGDPAAPAIGRPIQHSDLERFELPASEAGLPKMAGSS